MGLILDTNFIVAAEREKRREIRGAAKAFFSAHPAESFVLTFTVVAELACGKSAENQIMWQLLWHPYQVLPWTMEISWRYGEIYRHLQRQGTMIGTNDLWIAATALVHGLGVVTNNVDEFRRVPGLAVFPY